MKINCVCFKPSFSKSYEKSAYINNEDALYYMQHRFDIITHSGDVFERRTYTHYNNPDEFNRVEKLKNDSAFRDISFDEAKNMITDTSIAAIREYIRDRGFKLQITNNPDDNPIIENMFEIDGKFYDAKFFGKGATKSAFLIEKDGKKYILAVCSHLYGSSEIKESWINMLQNEPKNTDFLRSKGFFVNDIFSIVPVKIDGTPFPAVLMKPYGEHSFEVADKKGFSNSNLLDIDSAKLMDNERFTKLYSTIAKEIGRLTALGIEPLYDCINLCKDKNTNEFHLYLSDLDIEISQKQLSEEEAKDYIQRYVYFAKTALPKILDYGDEGGFDYLFYIGVNSKLSHILEDMAYQEYLKCIHK